MTFESESTQSVNTIHLEDDKLVGHNTDIEGFERSIQDLKLNLINKKALVLGAGGVVPSIIFALNKMKISEVIISNRTKSKAESLKDLFKNIKIVELSTAINNKNAQSLYESLDYERDREYYNYYLEI